MQSNKPTADQVRALVIYDPETGIFVRRKTNTVTGYRAANGHTQIGIGKTLCYAQRLAWLYTYGVWPTNRIAFINGDCTDNRIANLIDAKQVIETKQSLSMQILKENLSYDKDTGIFIRLKTTGPRKYVGHPAGWLDRHGYVYINLIGGRFSAHQLAWFYVTGTWPVNVIDHIDGNPGNNRFDNLRDVSILGNAQNMRHSMAGKQSTKLLGAYRNHNKWMARIKVNKQDKYLGTFDTPELAHQAYLEAKRIYHPTCTI